MAKQRNEEDIKRCGRLTAPFQPRPSKPGARVDRPSIVRKGSDPSASMGDWVIDEAE